MMLCDGHKSHFTPETISNAAKRGVVVFCILPNSTHAAQPLDELFLFLLLFVCLCLFV